MSCDKACPVRAIMLNSTYHMDKNLLVVRSWLVSLSFIVKDVVFINATNLIQFSITPFCIPVFAINFHCLLVVAWN